MVEEGSRAEAHNAGAAQASGEYLLFLAPDTEIVEPSWLSQLVLHASLPGVAAVGPKLVRPDGKVEQAGIAIGLRDPAAPMLAGVGAEGDGYYGALPCSREVSGLSAECMLVARQRLRARGRVRRVVCQRIRGPRPLPAARPQRPQVRLRGDGDRRHATAAMPPAAAPATSSTAPSSSTPGTTSCSPATLTSTAASPASGPTTSPRAGWSRSTGRSGR